MTTHPAALFDPQTADPLETLFGDPLDPANPLGYDAFLAADERGELLQAGRAALDAFGLGAAFVPRTLGGRFAQADELARLLRPVFRRDGALGLGHGASNLIGSTTVWTAGSDEQRRRLAALLLSGGQTAAAMAEVAEVAEVADLAEVAEVAEVATEHDRDRSQVTAAPHGDRFVLNGRRELVNEVSRAHAVTVLARTDDAAGGRSHSLFLLDMAAVPRDRLGFLPRHRTAGLRATHLGGLEFRHLPLPAEALVGEPGGGLETVLRASQVTESVLTSAMLGLWDTQLRVVTGFARERRLYRRAVSELPHPRSVLTGAFVDLLIADCLATTACRALHVLPRQTSVYSAAARYLVPTLAQEAVDQLAVVLGARSFLREGPHGIFQKHLRDLSAGTLADPGTTSGEVVMIRQLPLLAEQSWFSTAPAPAQLFDLGAALPDLDFQRLEITAAADDGLAATLPAVCEELRDDPVLGPLCEQLTTEFRALREKYTELAPSDRTPLAGPAAFDLVDRYAVLMAAAACLGVWRHNRDHAGPFLGGTSWLAVALHRLTARLGHPQPPARGVADAADAVLDELMARHEENRSFDLTGRRLC